MADEEKTEEPTSKRLSDARADGNVLKSQEVSGVIGLIVSFVLLISLISHVAKEIAKFYYYINSKIGVDLNIQSVYEIAIFMFYHLILIVLPISAVIMFVGIMSNVIQTGFNFTTKPIKPKFSKLNPIKGLKNLFSFKKLVDCVKIILKTMAVFGVMFFVFRGFMEQTPKLLYYDFFHQLMWLKDKLIIIFSIIILLFMIFAAFDYIMARHNYFKGLRMSKQEVKDEFKQAEGDPKVKGKIRQIQIETFKKRMMQDVANADVVITNPTHFAVALAYDKSTHEAPVVLAKGADNIALKIKQIAIENDIMILERRELARELFKVCDIGQTIPQRLFEAVAKVLSFVYKVKGKNA